ncbi:MAG: AgmX/PglI C-terminal domain-containing protein [Polyangiaceae bacterium]
MVDSVPPPENKSGAGLYIVGALLLAGGIAAIVFYTSKSDAPVPTPTAVATQDGQEPRGPAPPPPPPPKPTTAEPTPSASTSASASSSAIASAGPATGPGPAVGGLGPCDKCGAPGTKASDALTSALSQAAGSARGCYNKAIQKSAASGRMKVLVTVGANGSVCGVSIGEDTVGNPEVSSCVLNRFQGKSFPKPEQGCVTIGIPVSFTVKDPK